MNIAECCCKIMWVFAVVLLVAIPYQVTSLMSICYWVMTIGNCISFICAYFSINPTGYRVTKDAALLVLLIVVSGSSLLLSGRFTFTVSNILGYIQFIGVIMAIYYSKILGQSGNYIKFIGIINVLIALLFVFFSYQGFAYRRGSIITASLSLGYQNPNITAIYLFMNASILLVTIGAFKHIAMKLLMIALIFLDITMMYRTDSRAVFFVYLFIVAVYVFKKRKFKIPKIFILLCVLFPFAFLFIYTYMYDNGILTDVMILGKSVYSGREVYFSDMLAEIGGSISGILFGEFRGFNNTHNSALGLISYFGILATIIYYLNWLYSLFHIAKHGFSNKIAYIAFISILALHIHSCAEAALIIGGGIWFVFTASIFSIARNNHEI